MANLTSIPQAAPDELFPEDDPSVADLKKKSVRGGMIMTVSQGVLFVLRTGSAIVLARLLTPDDFGLYGMVAVLVAFLNSFTDFGLPMATVQKPTLNRSEANTLFWVTVGFGCLMMGLLAMSSPVIAWFYDEDRLVAITLLLSLTFALRSLAGQHSALLKRSLRFGALAVVQVIATLAGITVAVTMAVSGAGYWALIWQPIVTAVISTLGFWMACGWIPGRPGSVRVVQSQLRFGGWLTGSELLHSLSQNIDKVLVGRFCGTGELGLYGRGFQLAFLPMQTAITPVGSVIVPALSRLQSDGERFCRCYCRFINTVTWLAAPMLAVLAALSLEFILVTIGPQWLAANMIFKAFALAGLVQPLLGSTGWIMVARGHTGRLFGWMAIRLLLLVVCLSAGLSWGAPGVAVAYTICSYLLAVPCIQFAVKGSPIATTDVLDAVSRPLVTGVVMYIVIAAVRSQFTQWHVLGTIAASGLTGMIAAGLLLALWPSARQEVLGLAALAKLALRRRSAES